ncbi:endolytic peptidoglycan transglycosylase RlpA [Klebsiella quasipneumoniae]|uniref:endolytic peptidoglycan transglycosylase RlpA n=13 Tax=Klebsiella pneumoniae complex TaxID=3390273 RepID=UPI0034DDEA52
MRKQWLGICIAAGLLAACSSDDVQQKTVSTPQPAVCNGPTVEISGADPQYETPNATANQDYERDGKRYKIVQDPANFTQAGFAAIYDAEPNSNLTASGETFDPTQLTAAHPTLPIPSYARITNLANGRMIVVRINDRGPYGNDRVISLSRASADRLNTSNNTKVRIDPIIVAPDGSLSGPGMACTTVAKQTYALPARPNLDGGDAAGMNQPAPTDVRPISNSTLKPEDSVGAPVNSGGFLGAPTPLNSGVLESSEPAATTVTAPAAGATPAAPVTAPGSIQGSVAPAAAAAATPAAPVTAPGSIQGSVAPAAAAAAVAASSSATSSASGNFVVQVGAVSDQARAQQYQQRLSQQFSVPGRVMQNGAVWRIQLGPFADKAQASAVQQRLQSEAQLQSFITRAN